MKHEPLPRLSFIPSLPLLFKRFAFLGRIHCDGWERRPLKLATITHHLLRVSTISGNFCMESSPYRNRDGKVAFGNFHLPPIATPQSNVLSQDKGLDEAGVSDRRVVVLELGPVSRLTGYWGW